MLSVISSVIAFITNRKKPSEIIVIGSVKITSTGRTIKFKIDKTRLAIIASEKLSTYSPGK
ncbi:hypothetical protein D3C72_2458740 [compost metagenome]